MKSKISNDCGLILIGALVMGCGGDAAPPPAVWTVDSPDAMTSLADATFTIRGNGGTSILIKGHASYGGDKNFAGVTQIDNRLLHAYTDDLEVTSGIVAPHNWSKSVYAEAPAWDATAMNGPGGTKLNAKAVCATPINYIVDDPSDFNRYDGKFIRIQEDQTGMFVP
ncbi:MAG: hypothetical protein CMJ78_12735 [Planctomycetaceae bacterium]|nr:hypothetical protein [Planctomycetaceae bacterium]